jgi:hypothetical protein
VPKIHSLSVGLNGNWAEHPRNALKTDFSALNHSGQSATALHSIRRPIRSTLGYVKTKKVAHKKTAQASFLAHSCAMRAFPFLRLT